jgi:hypothetical protein
MELRIITVKNSDKFTFFLTFILYSIERQNEYEGRIVKETDHGLSDGTFPAFGCSKGKKGKVVPVLN